MKSTLVAFATAALLAGCATKPTDLVAAHPVPAERRSPLAKPTAANPGKISFVMDTGASATDYLVTVSIDARRVADLRVGEIATFEVEPGELQISADHNFNIGTYKAYRPRQPPSAWTAHHLSDRL